MTTGITRSLASEGRLAEVGVALPRGERAQKRPHGAWWLGVRRRLCDWIARQVPTGYQDQAGFHYGEQHRGPRRP